MAKVSERCTTRGIHQKRIAAAGSIARRESRRAPGPDVECLENRSLLSTLVLSGFPTQGFRAKGLGGPGPWELTTLVNGQETTAVAFAEGSETMPAAPRVSLVDGEPSWVAGIIGDTLLRSATAANDVDYYRIDLPRQGHFAIRLDVLAQQIGSKLDAAVSLFDANGNLIASNDNARQANYLSDSQLFGGLDGGTYFVAVSASGSVPGQAGGLDPARLSRGQYLLRVEADPDGTRPQVVAINIEDGATLDEPPTWITIQFSEPMDLAGLETGVTLTNATGQPLALAPIHYDSSTNEITYLVLDRAVTGDYQLTLHSSLITDRANNPLDGSTSGGDFVVSFHVTAPVFARVDAESNESIDMAQPLGALFERELRSSVRVDGVVPSLTTSATASTSESNNVTDTDQDFYRIEVLRGTIFRFRLQFDGAVPAGASMTLRDAAGNVLVNRPALPGFGTTVYRKLDAGEYFVQIEAESGENSATYKLTIAATSQQDVPLRDNEPGPSVQVELRSHDVVTPPASGESTKTSVLDARGEIVAAVSALPSVASVPLARPRVQPASRGELAWLDGAASQSALPAGFSLRTPQDPTPAVSVDRVSGSFLDALPNQLDQGTHALGASSGVITELTGLLRGHRDAPAASRRGSGETAIADESLPVSETGDEESDASPLAMSPKTVSLGMAVALGVASAVTVPQRRRSTNWLQRAIEVIGMDT